MKVKSSSKLMQYHLFEQNTQDIPITDNLDNEIECPRCHDVMTLFSGFDFLGPPMRRVSFTAVHFI